jgi:hypothetical protein
MFRQAMEKVLEYMLNLMVSTVAHAILHRFLHFFFDKGEKFTWFHADGSYATWNIDSTDPPEDQKYVPYGPDPCKAINQLYRGFRG